MKSEGFVLPISKMIIFSKGGKVLWSKGTVKGDPVNVLIQTVLLEEKGVRQSCEIEGYRVEWRLVNETEAVIGCLSERSMDFSGSEVLEATKKAFLVQGISNFDDRFRNIEKELEAKYRMASKKTVTTNGTQQQQKKTSSSSKKKQREWGLSTKKKLSAEEAEKLDYSAKSDVEAVDATTAKYLPEDGEVAAWDEAEEEVDLGEDFDDDRREEEKKGLFSRMTASLTTNTTLTEESVGGIMEDLRTLLIAKNVAAEIAAEITASVQKQLVGKQVDRFTRTKTLVKEALVAAVERILTPRTSTDVLAGVLRRKADSSTKKKPYVIVFVGINGVGKSTTLSKVAYYLKTHGASILVAACDTFRSGAVEQLRSHTKCLDIDLFERGYLKDPADVAKAAIDYAAKQKIDVVLVDTAGRMQNNASLMRQLARLLAVNDPDVTLFVGEALVGNDGIDQLTMFDNALKKDSANSIDALVLTKFDCIDDKVGAVLSMTYQSGLPVAFVGVGQKYTHLKKLSVNNVLNALFKR